MFRMKNQFGLNASRLAKAGDLSRAQRVSEMGHSRQTAV
jgi:hypothetical protein